MPRSCACKMMAPLYRISDHIVIVSALLLLCVLMVNGTNPDEYKTRSSYLACIAAGEHQQMAQFRADSAQDQLVYGPDYLTDRSVVFDIGGYTGEADQVYWDKYHPNMYVFEPVTSYYKGLKHRFGHLPKIRLFEYAIGSEDKQMAIRITGDSSTVVPLEQRTDDDQVITMRTLKHVFRDHNIDKVDLLYINCEGCEYSVLEYIIDQGHITRFNNLMIQFHKRPQSVENRCRIRELLSRTHDNTWTYAYVWENWHLKTWTMPDHYRAKLAAINSPIVSVFSMWLILLLGVCIVVVYQAYRSADSRHITPVVATSDSDSASSNSLERAFRSFQYKYIAIFLLMTAADWLQGPYIYALYKQYGFSIEDIGHLFVAGFASSMIFGTIVASVADNVGRKKLCLVYCALYSIACLTKHSPRFEVLLLGRLFSGIATSILFSAFEAWMVDEHARCGFRFEWLSSTFFYVHFANSIVAILSGLVAEATTNRTGKPTTSFDIAIVCLVIGGLLIAFYWKENFGGVQREADVTVDGSSSTNITAVTTAVTANHIDSLRRALRVLRTDGKVLCVGLAQGFFEASMYIFVFIWTPVLERHYLQKLPHGTVFASFMVACMIGSAAFSWLTKTRGIKPENMLVYIFAVSMASMSVAMLFQSLSGSVVLVSFFCFECCVGAFWPSIGTLRSGLITADLRATILTLFRLPANFIVLVTLNKIKAIPIPAVFGLCVVMLLVSLCAQLRLRTLLARTHAHLNDKP